MRFVAFLGNFFFRHLLEDLSPLSLVKRSIDHRLWAKWRTFMLMRGHIKIGYTPPYSHISTYKHIFKIQRPSGWLAGEFPISLWCLQPPSTPKRRSNLYAHRFAPRLFRPDWAKDRTKKNGSPCWIAGALGIWTGAFGGIGYRHWWSWSWNLHSCVSAIHASLWIHWETHRPTPLHTHISFFYTLSWEG